MFAVYLALFFFDVFSVCKYMEKLEKTDGTAVLF